MALLVSRVSLSKKVGRIWQVLTNWATNKKESKILRANSIQGFFNLVTQHQELKQDFDFTIIEIEKEDVLSINARLKKLKHASC